MISVTAIRGAGDRPMPDIVEGVLAGSREALQARADAELDAVWPDARTADIEIAPRPDIRPGMIIKVRESGQPDRVCLVQSVVVEESRGDPNGPLSRVMRLVVEYRVEQQ